MRVVFELDGLPPSTLAALLGALLNIDMAYLRAQPGTPSLYKSGVRYRRERFGREVFKDVSHTLDDGHGDCEDLASWRCAELRVRDDEDARLIIRFKRDARGRPRYHVLVRRGDGSLEDPSRRLGMEEA